MGVACAIIAYRCCARVVLCIRNDGDSYAKEYDMGMVCCVGVYIVLLSCLVLDGENWKAEAKGLVKHL